jgi:hypothetical protein
MGKKIFFMIQAIMQVAIFQLSISCASCPTPRVVAPPPDQTALHMIEKVVEDAQLAAQEGNCKFAHYYLDGTNYIDLLARIKGTTEFDLYVEKRKEIIRGCDNNNNE